MKKLVLLILLMIGLIPTPVNAFDVCYYLHPDTTQISAFYILVLTAWYKLQNPQAPIETTFLGLVAAGLFNFLATIERALMVINNCPAQP